LPFALSVFQLMAYGGACCWVGGVGQGTLKALNFAVYECTAHVPAQCVAFMSAMHAGQTSGLA
jgi:hypothetical protein